MSFHGPDVARLWIVRLESVCLSLSAVALAVFLPLSACAACGASDVLVSSVPVELNAAGATYCLTGDIETGSGSFVIKNSNVTLNGDGHAVKVPSRIESSQKYDGVTIRDIKLADGEAVFAYQGGAKGLQILDSELTGITLLEATQFTIKGNKVSGGMGISGRTHCVEKGGDGTSVGCGVGRVVVVDIWSEDDLIEDNSFYGENLTDVRFIQIANARGMTFTNNRVEIVNSTGNILQVHYTTDSTFEGNTILSDIDPPKGGETYGMHIRDVPTRLTFRNNRVRSSGTNCMLMGGSGNQMFLKGVNDTLTDPWGYDNLVEGNEFILEASSISDAAIRYDTSNGGDRFTNNVIYSAANTTASFRVGAVPPAGDPVLVRNNTVVAETGAPALNFMEGTEQDGLFKLRNNIFYHGEAGGTAIAGSVPTADTDYNLYFPAASAFLARESHSLGADPLFVNASALDFHLSDGSPAIGAGDDGKDMGVDFSTFTTPGDGVSVHGGCSAEALPPIWIFAVLALAGARRLGLRIPRDPRRRTS